MNFTEDIVGLAVLAVEFVIAYLTVSINGMSLVIWIGIYVIFAVVGLATWDSEKAPQNSQGWLKMVAGSFVLGLFFFAADIFVGYLAHPDLPLIEAGAKAPFGFFLTLIACPGLTVISVAGLFRDIYRRKRQA